MSESSQTRTDSQRASELSSLVDRAKRFTELLLDHSEGQWPKKFVEFGADYLMGEHNRETERTYFLAGELQRVIAELEAELGE